MTLSELNIFRAALGISESGGKYDNDLGQYWGKYQFGDARRRDIEAMLNLHHLSREEFTPAMQEQFFNAHINDYEKRIYREGLQRYFGTQITGKRNNITALINKFGIIAGAHLGGFEGVKKYFSTGYDPADKFGTYISDYIAKFSNITEKKTLI